MYTQVLVLPRSDFLLHVAPRCSAQMLEYAARYYADNVYELEDARSR